MASKYKRGAQITSLDTFAACDFVMFNGKVYHKGFAQSWQFRAVKDFIRAGRLYEAVKKEPEMHFCGDCVFFEECKITVSEDECGPESDYGCPFYKDRNSGYSSKKKRE